MLSPSQSLNLKALKRTLDKTEVSSFQGVVGRETLDMLHRNARRSAATAWDPSPATAWDPSQATAWDPSPATVWVPSAATAWDASAATAWDASPATAWDA
jgi:hypothetical protein